MTGSNFPSEIPISDMELRGMPVGLDDPVNTSADGSFTTTFTVPGLDPGRYFVNLSASHGIIQVAADVTVQPPGLPPPRTTEPTSTSIGPDFRAHNLLWVKDDLSDAEAVVLHLLDGMGLILPGTTYEKLLCTPWLVDGITEEEERAFFPVSNKISRRYDDEYASDFDSLWELPWFKDGLSKEESVLMTIILEFIGLEDNILDKILPNRSEVFRGLMSSGRVQSEEFALASGPISLYVVRWSTSEVEDHTLFEHLRTGIEAIENFMGAPWVRTEVVLLLNPELLLGGLYVGEFIQSTSESSIYHELAHYYFSGHRLWLTEGAAEFLDTYTRHVNEGTDLKARHEIVQEQVQRGCAELLGVSNIQEGLDYIGESSTADIYLEPIFLCQYPLGESFLLGMYNALGHEVVETSLRELHEKSLEVDAELTEEEIYHVFLSNTPVEKQDMFRDLYSRFHGGPIPE